MNCRVCGEIMNFEEKIYECMAESFEFNDYPFEAKNKDVDLYICPKCGHLQIENKILSDFYDRYSEFSGSNQYQGNLDVNKTKINNLYNYLKIENGFDKLSLLDIGCGCGKNLKIATSFFNKCVGIEPAKNSYEISKKMGLEVIEGYFNSKLNIKEKFTSFISMQVFEHLDNLYEVLDYAYEILDYGGVGLINVPNGQLIKKNKYYHQIILEHVNYFTPFSLSTMARMSGFDIIKVEAIDDTMELDLYVRKYKSNIGFNEIRENHRFKLRQLLSESNNVSIWGAGAKAFKYNRLLPKDLKLNHLLDSSKEKKGKYVSGINIPIERATREIVNENDTIIIFASSYNKEIIKDLQEKYNFKGKIIYFENENIKIM